MAPGARLALGPDHGGPFPEAAQRLAQVATAAHEGHGEGVLVDVVLLIGRGQDLRLVDVIDSHGLQDLGLDEVADPALGHDRDGHRLLDPLDHGGVRHAGHPAGRPDVRGHPL
jgi:hypothetical protein